MLRLTNHSKNPDYFLQAKPSLICISQLFSNLVIIYLLAYEDGTECSETSAYKIQTPGNYPEENIQQCKIIPELWTQHHLNPRWKVHFNPSSGYKELDQR